MQINCLNQEPTLRLPGMGLSSSSRYAAEPGSIGFGFYVHQDIGIHRFGFFCIWFIREAKFKNLWTPAQVHTGETRGWIPARRHTGMTRRRGKTRPNLDPGISKRIRNGSSTMDYLIIFLTEKSALPTAPYRNDEEGASWMTRI